MTKEITVLHYDAFSSKANQGNPAGVVLDAEDLSEAEMQQIAKEVGFNETVFVLDSEVADLKLKYFTPGHEINLCGHATVASLYSLKSKGYLEGKDSLLIETKAGIRPIWFTYEDEQLMITMRQGQPEFMNFDGDPGLLADSLGISIDHIDTALPIVYGSTGTWTLIVPIKELSIFPLMSPKSDMFPKVLTWNPKCSVHPICTSTYDAMADMHARHFSSPYSGTIEDPVTGTASAVMGAYFLTYLEPDLPSVELLVEQGQELGRDGRVRVKASRVSGQIEVMIAGTGVYVGEMKITI